MQNRQQNWIALCSTFLIEHEKTPFRWGEFDCCLFVADWVKMQFGVDPAAQYRGKYSTERGSIRALKKYGAKTSDLKQAWTHALNIEPTNGCAANRGDVVLVKQPCGNELIGVFYANCVFAVSTDGLIRLKPSLIQCHWRLAA